MLLKDRYAPSAQVGAFIANYNFTRNRNAVDPMHRNGGTFELSLSGDTRLSYGFGEVAVFDHLQPNFNDNLNLSVEVLARSLSTSKEGLVLNLDRHIAQVRPLLFNALDHLARDGLIQVNPVRA
ncbi:MAG: hypothetical protein AABX35_02205 [Nanoarchaeota archaeon]